jgi:hypothetical protein
MAGLVFGGLIYRGGLVSILIAASIDAGFGIVLVTLEHDSLRRLLKILGPSDVAAIHDALAIAGFVMIGAGVICLAALPQGIRYARWFRDAAVSRSAMSTARGFPPPPVPVRGSAFIIPAEDQPAVRRRLYLVLGGAAVVVGVAIGVLVSWRRTEPARETAVATAAVAGSGPRVAVAGPGSGRSSGPGSGQGSVRGSGQGSGQGSAAATAPAIASGPQRAPETAVRSPGGPAADPRGAGAGSAVTVKPVGTVQDLVLAQHAAVARADRKALAGLLAAGAFGFGIGAGEVADGRDAVVAQIVHDLGEPPAGGFTVESKAIAIGEDRGHAWIAEQLEVTAGREVRSFAVSELAAVIDGGWRVVALHWGTPVADATAQRLAILSRLPVPARIADRRDASGELDRAVRAAFANRAAFAEAHSERPDAFNYGSGGERAHGGAAIQRIFSKLKAQIRLHDGARVATGDAWDPAQKDAPRVGWAALNVDYTTKTRAATEVTQTFRVLAVLVKEDRGWKIVQTQWSNGGPIL